jgi:hypothetical protein
VLKEKAYTQALHGHQAQEVIMGYQSMPVQALIETLPPTTGTAMSLSTNWDDVKSEDEDEPLSLAQGVS